MSEQEIKMSKTKKVTDEAEVIRMQMVENPGIALVSSFLNGKNYLSWSRAMRIALGAKMKLDYFNGKSQKPQEDYEYYKQWLMQFLMGLHESLDHVRNQILLMEPFSSVNKAYSMILTVEKQRETITGNASSLQNMAMQVK
ncbi:UNVERIFIED_CONTAM: hypothetical protein Sindi_1646600 [Sesamum indicum]